MRVCRQLILLHEKITAVQLHANQWFHTEAYSTDAWAVLLSEVLVQNHATEQYSNGDITFECE